MTIRSFLTLLPLLFSPTLLAENQPGKFGYIDPTGKIVLECQWDDATKFHNGRASVCRDGKWAVIDKTGKKLTPFKWNYINAYHDNKLAITTLGKKKGVIDYEGKVILKAEWDKVDIYDYNKTIHIEDGDFLRFFDFEGTELLKTKKSESLRLHNKLFEHRADKINKKTILYSADKKICYTELDTIDYFNEGVLFSKGDQFGYISHDLSIHVPLSKSEISIYVGGVFAVQHSKQDTLFTLDGKQRVIKDFEIVEPKKLYLEGLYLVRDKETKKFGFIDIRGKIILPCVWDSAKTFRDGMATVKVGERFGAINAKGELAIPAVWDDVDVDEPNKIAVKKGNKFGSVDSKGEILVEPIWDSLCWGPLDDTWLCERNGKFGVIKLNGEILLKPEWDEIDEESKNLFRGVKGGKHALIRKDGVVLSGAIWDNVQANEYGATVERAGKYGVVNLKGELILKPEWDWAQPSGDGKFIIADEDTKTSKDSTLLDMDGKAIHKFTSGHIQDLATRPGPKDIFAGYSYYHGFKITSYNNDIDIEAEGYINKLGKITIPCIYYNVDLESDIGIFAVESKNEMWGFRDTDGKWITPLKWQFAQSFSEGLAPVQLPDPK